MSLRDEKQSGQILLIIILVATVLLTIGLSVSQLNVQEQRISKLEEDQKRAFSVAEAGLDAALKLAPGSPPLDLSTLGLGGGITGSATLQTTQQTTFHTSVLAKDDQYTLYLADYDSSSTPPFQNYFSGNLIFYLKTGSSCPALELTLIDNNNNATRRLIDPCSQVAPGIPDITTANNSPAPAGFTEYEYKTTAQLSFGPANKTQVIIIRNLFADTKVGVEASVNLPLQGKTIVSTASTSTGVTQKVELFQSHPQIPASFYVTSF